MKMTRWEGGGRIPDPVDFAAVEVHPEALNGGEWISRCLWGAEQSGPDRSLPIVLTGMPF